VSLQSIFSHHKDKEEQHKKHFFINPVTIENVDNFVAENVTVSREEALP